MMADHLLLQGLEGLQQDTNDVRAPLISGMPP